MYVERLDPLEVVQPLPIIFIHGDWHTGQIWTTKPDGRPGWAAHFLYQGYRVFVVDLPASGRSNSLTGSQVHIANQSPVPNKGIVSRDVTATASQTHEGWETAKKHNKWPGNGQPGDEIFERYYASLVPLLLRKVDRQRLGQSALSELLEITGPAVLIGEGTGATMAWLAADVKPHLVAHVMAIEPAGPPCGSARGQGLGGSRRFTSFIRLDPNVRPYGLADIPMRFEPPVSESDPADDNNDDDDEKNTGNPSPKLDVLPTRILNEGGGTCVMQRCADNSHVRTTAQPRRLVNLQRMRHTVVTAQASSHSTYDWATVKFLRQAGVRVEGKRLEEYGVTGNGHLMFLEVNSDEIACLIGMWISGRFPAQPPPHLSAFF
ncbi:hypothetical protein CP532_3494 [Ophiocordyceps camponoti-leonardi (nom. inval.)]|nr:hypothetical protein CP532_3494 [Ophiocordyceps camponoti-leonardi (nom. inval.)]